MQPPQMSPAREKMLAFIEAQVAMTGRFPPIASMQQHMGYETAAGVRDILGVLVVLGKIRVISREPSPKGKGWRYHYALAKVPA